MIRGAVFCASSFSTRAPCGRQMQGCSGAPSRAAAQGLRRLQYTPSPFLPSLGQRRLVEADSEGRSMNLRPESGLFGCHSSSESGSRLCADVSFEVVRSIEVWGAPGAFEASTFVGFEFPAQVRRKLPYRQLPGGASLSVPSTSSSERSWALLLLRPPQCVAAHRRSGAPKARKPLIVEASTFSWRNAT